MLIVYRIIISFFLFYRQNRQKEAEIWMTVGYYNLRTDDGQINTKFMITKWTQL